jgi:hypothetical protein
MVTETVYRQQLRPVIEDGAEVMDRILAAWPPRELRWLRHPLIGTPPRHPRFHRRGRPVTSRVLPPNLESVRRMARRDPATSVGHDVDTVTQGGLIGSPCSSAM